MKEEFLDLDEGVLTDEEEETDATATFNLDTSAPTFKSPALLSKTDIEKMLPTLNRIESWIEAIFAYVSSEASTTELRGMAIRWSRAGASGSSLTQSRW